MNSEPLRSCDSQTASLTSRHYIALTFFCFPGHNRHVVCISILRETSFAVPISVSCPAKAASPVRLLDIFCGSEMLFPRCFPPIPSVPASVCGTLYPCRNKDTR